MRLDEVRAIKETIRSDAVVAHTELAAAAAEGPPVLGDIMKDPERPRGVAVGVGLTETEDEYRVAVRVPDKQAEEWFRAKYAALIDQYGKDIDIRIITRSPPSFRPESSLSSVTRSLSIGSRVRHAEGSDGTLGFFARRGEELGFVSCNHVIALTDSASLGDKIVHVSTGDVVGNLANVSPLRLDRPKADCAFAEISDRKFVPKVPGRVNGFVLKRGPMPELKSFLPVVKVGAITKITRGRISAHELVDLDVDYVDFFAHFDDVLEIESMEVNQNTGMAEVFSDDGDSGSAVFSESDLNPLGMLFYKTTGGPDNSGLSYANPITSIEDALGVVIVL